MNKIIASICEMMAQNNKITSVKLRIKIENVGDTSTEKVDFDVICENHYDNADVKKSINNVTHNCKHVTKLDK